jgi:hypothetical protein
VGLWRGKPGLEDPFVTSLTKIYLYVMLAEWEVKYNRQRVNESNVKEREES